MIVPVKIALDMDGDYSLYKLKRDGFKRDKEFVTPKAIPLRAKPLLDIENRTIYFKEIDKTFNVQIDKKTLEKLKPLDMKDIVTCGIGKTTTKKGYIVFYMYYINWIVTK